MKMKRFFTIALAVAALVSCQSGTDEVPVGSGRMQFDVVAQSRVESPSAGEAQGGYEIAVPALAEFSLTVEGAGGFSKRWPSLADFSADESFLQGDYTVSVQYGEPTDEGFEKPWFFASQSVYVDRGDRISEVDMTVVLANSIVEIAMSDTFKGYFVEHAFTLVSASGAEYVMSENSEQDLYLPAGEPVTVRCSCVRQADAALGLKTELSQSITPRACTRHIVRFDIQKAGSVVLNVTLDDRLVASEVIDVELNENA